MAPQPAQPSGEGPLPDAPRNASGRVLAKAQKQSRKSPQDLIGAVEAALGRLVLTPGERGAWNGLKELVAGMGGSASQGADSEPISQKILELKEEIQNLAAILKKTSEGSKQKSWAQVAAPMRPAAPAPARKAREILGMYRGTQTDSLSRWYTNSLRHIYRPTIVNCIGYCLKILYYVEYI